MEFIKVYKKNEGKINEKVIDVYDVSLYLSMGWVLEKPEEKVIKLSPKKESKKHV